MKNATLKQQVKEDGTMKYIIRVTNAYEKPAYLEHFEGDDKGTSYRKTQLLRNAKRYDEETAKKIIELNRKYEECFPCEDKFKMIEA